MRSYLLHPAPLTTLGLREKFRQVRSLLGRSTLRRRVVLWFSATSSVFVVIVVSASGFSITKYVRSDKISRVQNRIEILSSSIHASRFLGPVSRRAAIQSSLNSLSKGSSDVYFVHFASGDLMLPPNWFLIPQDQVRLLLLGNSSKQETALVTGTNGDRFELSRYSLKDHKAFIDVYRNISLEDQLVLGYVVQGLLSTLVAIGVFVVMGLWLSAGIVKPVVALDDVVSGLTPENLQASLVEMNEAPVELAHLASSTVTMARRLERAWDNQKMFVSAVSHEFRNSMTVICGYLERVQRDSQSITPRHRKAIDEIAYESKRLVKMFDQLLQISRIEMNKQSIKLKSVDIIRIVREIVGVRSSLMDRPIGFGIDLDSIATAELFVDIDETSFEQVLSNLLENAFKYSADAALVHVCVSCSTDFVIIGVSDQGIGIPEADQARIFERFYRGSNAAAHADGTGLGLPLDRMLMQRMNGDLQLAGSSSEGSTFEILLPLQKPQ